MLRFAAVVVALVSFVPLTHAAETLPPKVDVESYGRAGFDVVVRNADGAAFARTAPVTLIVTARGGTIRPITENAQPWVPAVSRRIAPNEAFPPFEYRPATPFWPEELTIYPTVQAQDGREIRGIPFTVVPKPPVLIGLALALAGAFVFTLIQIFHSTARSVKSVGAALALGLGIGLLGFFGVEFRPIWQVVGFDQSPLRVQSYFVLSFMLALVGVPKFFNQITGAEKQSLVTPQGLREEVLALLTGDTVRRPLREELQAMLYDARYIREHPDVMARLDVALTEARDAGAVPAGLGEYLVPRLAQLYTSSYRRGLQTRIDATIHESAIHWVQSDYYEFVRRGSVALDEPEVRVAYLETVLPSCRSRTIDEIESLGTVMQSIELKIRHDDIGSLVYSGKSGKTLTLSEAPPNVDAERELPITLEFNRDNNEVKAAFEYRMPKAYRSRNSGVFIEIRADWLRAVEDGVSYFRVSRPTFGYDLAVKFTPRVQLELAEFEWKRVGPTQSNVDDKAGTAHLSGWLLPGNGICIAWHGTADARKATAPAAAESFLRRLVKNLFKGRTS